MCFGCKIVFWVIVLYNGMPALDTTSQIVETPRERALRVIRQIVFDSLSGTSARVYLVGSCASGDYKRHSDIDIVIDLLQPTSKVSISEIRSMLEQSDIPFFVDVFDFHQLDEHYRAEIKKDGVQWTESQ